MPTIPGANRLRNRAHTVALIHRIQQAPNEQAVGERAEQSHSQVRHGGGLNRWQTANRARMRSVDY